MKKYLILIIFLICLSINTYNAFDKNNCIKEIRPKDLNSKDVINYLSENNLIDKVNKICSVDICTSLNSSNLERDLKYFIDKNINYLQNKHNEAAIEAELKGFKIDKLILFSC